MITLEQIRKDLREIRYYGERKQKRQAVYKGFRVYQRLPPCNQHKGRVQRSVLRNCRIRRTRY